MKSPRAHLSHPKYRRDIDGLRAVAVLSVVAFHAFPGLLTGGFIGVDIFFVISGYLITTIMLENLNRGTFSFSEFYARRIKRIFPALLLVLAATYVIGWYVLLADEYRQLGKHIVAGAGFVSNIALWGEAGYFDNSAETKPLLHLWSLGIEEQFYIVWPLLLWFAWRSRFNLLVLTALVAAISLYINLTETRHDAVAGFYSPQTRFWELLSGSLLAWLQVHRTDTTSPWRSRLGSWLASGLAAGEASGAGRAVENAIATIGLLLLGWGFWHIRSDFPFPGSWALVPVSGAVLIVLAGPNAWINRYLLGNQVAVWFGLISFPLYLWHWPLLTFTRIAASGDPGLTTRLAVVCLSIGLAWLTYRAIERPIRLGKDTRAKVPVLVLLMVVSAAIGYVTYSRNGLPFRAEDREAFIGYFENSFPTWRYFARIDLDVEWRAECSFFNSEKYLREGKLEGGVANSKPVARIDPSCYQRDLSFPRSVFIWGDSHAQAISSGVVKNIPKEWQVLQVASSGCLPDPRIAAPSTTSQCDQSNYFALKTMREAKPDVVVIAQARGHSTKKMKEIAAALEAAGVRRILFVGPFPRWTTDLPRIMARQLWATKPMRTTIGLHQGVLKKNAKILREFQPTALAGYVDVIGLFCNDKGCLTYTDDSDIKGSITTWDTSHLTPSASGFLGERLLVERIVAH